MKQQGSRRLWLRIGALALASCSVACASTGAVPRPFPTPGAQAVQAAPPAPSGPSTPTEPPDPVLPPPARIAPFPGAPAGPRASGRAERPGIDGYALVGTALSLRGSPYRNGGTDPNGFDCSGFTQYVFGQYGVALPRDVREQYRVGKPVEPEDLAPGDIVFFATTDPGPSHVAIAIGGDGFVHAPSSAGVVRVEHLGSTYWSPRFLGARRLAN